MKQDELCQKKLEAVEQLVYRLADIVAEFRQDNMADCASALDERLSASLDYSVRDGWQIKYPDRLRKIDGKPERPATPPPQPTLK